MNKIYEDIKYYFDKLAEDNIKIILIENILKNGWNIHNHKKEIIQILNYIKVGTVENLKLIEDKINYQNKYCKIKVKNPLLRYSLTKDKRLVNTILYNFNFDIFLREQSNLEKTFDKLLKIEETVDEFDNYIRNIKPPDYIPFTYIKVVQD